MSRLHLVLTNVSSLVLLFGVSTSYADTADFEGLDPLIIPSTPFDSGGLTFTSEFAENTIVPPGAGVASDNGTQTFAWCGSGCGGTQLVTVEAIDGGVFNLDSLDAGNLAPAGTPLGFVPGMTLEVVGHQVGGQTIQQSLVIQENTFTTFDLIGFNSLEFFELFAPEVTDSTTGAVLGNPDPLVDNINFTPVPEPGACFALVIASVMFVRRRR